MISKLLLSAALVAGLATSAMAGVMVSPLGDTGTTITRVAEGCGPGMWRGPHGGCHPYAHDRACPRGYHLGREGRRCWPN
ncbi:MAG: GCG_CRPN prefix-to-repeats domain-containing protein [Methylovirgula sp.]